MTLMLLLVGRGEGLRDVYIGYVMILVPPDDLIPLPPCLVCSGFQFPGCVAWRPWFSQSIQVPPWAAWVVTRNWNQASRTPRLSPYKYATPQWFFSFFFTLPHHPPLSIPFHLRFFTLHLTRVYTAILGSPTLPGIFVPMHNFKDPHYTQG